MSNERAKRDLRKRSKQGKPVSAEETMATYGNKRQASVAALKKLTVAGKKLRWER